MSKRERPSSDGNPSSKKFKSAKEAAADSVIRAQEPELKTSDDGEKYWELSAKRRVTVSKFKNATFINLREFYDKDGKTLPGKQGIALNVEQFAVLLKAVPAIKTALSEQGIEIADDDEGEDELEETDDIGNDRDQIPDDADEQVDEGRQQ